jgi:hypothetical protein
VKPHTWFQNGEDVTDGRGNRGRAYRFWDDVEKVSYFRVRVTSGPLREARPHGHVWVSAVGWRGLVDYDNGSIEHICLECCRSFVSPLPLAPGEEFCKACNEGQELALWLKDYAGRLKAWQQAQAEDVAALRKKGA